MPFFASARGLMEAPQSATIYTEDGRVAWSVTADDFQGGAPDTANPSLWRNTQLNAYAGLFEVCDGIYQVRGYDMANAAFIRTDHGYIIFDVLMCQEDMASALALAEKHLGEMNVVAVAVQPQPRRSLRRHRGAAQPRGRGRSCPLPGRPAAAGRLAMGIGMEQAVGTVGLLAPTYAVKGDETLAIDGPEIQFN